MACNNAEKQRRHRQRLKERGLVQVQGWVTPEKAEAIRQIMADQATDAARVRNRWSAETDEGRRDNANAESQTG
jgi:hypothetical protein